MALENRRLTTTASDGYALAQMPLQIPEDRVPAIAKIIKLPNSSVDELIKALSSAAITPEPAVMAKQIANHVASIPLKDLTDIVETLYALYHVREFAEVRPSRFLNDLLEGVQANSAFHLGKPDDVASLRKKLQRLLNTPTLNTLSKAVRLQRGGERLYCDAKIVTDIRPVFGDDVTSKPVSGIVTHTLKLGYHEDGRHKTFFMALDDEDLVSLQDLVKRAKSKSKSLTKFLADAGLPRLGI